MKKRRIKVKQHTRNLKLGGTTIVKAHNRTAPQRSKLKQMTAGGMTSQLLYSDPYLETLVAKCEVGGKEACVELIKYAYENRNVDLLPGGYADLKRLEDFPLPELIRGIEVEFEHTNDPLVAIEIVMDHLTESFEYYIELEKMEKKLEKL